MQTVQVIPSSIGTGVAEFGDREIGVLRIACGGQLSHVGLDVLLDLADLGALEAEISALRERLVGARS